MQEQIIISRIKLIDETILSSNGVHDMVCHEIDGKKICLDGGSEYTRLVGDFSLITEEKVSITTETPIEEIREVYNWGTYGKKGDEDFHRVKLKDMSNKHIEAIIETQRQIPDYIIRYVFNAELIYREINNLYIED